MLIPRAENDSKNKKYNKTNSTGDIHEILQDTVFCNIPREELTPNQEKLRSKLDNEERKQLGRIVIHNKQTGEWEFQKAEIAMTDKDVIQNVKKQGADDVIENLGKKWQLTQNSDFDKMIIGMPGKTDDDRAENFRLLTGVSGRYWTAQNHGGLRSRFIVRIFNRDKSCIARGDDTDNDTHVRAVRHL